MTFARPPFSLLTFGSVLQLRHRATGHGRLSAAVLAALAALAVPVDARAQNPFDGEKIYETHCVSCHGRNGQPTLSGTPSFARGERLHLPDTVLLQSLQNGKGVCPAWRPLISDRDLLDVLAYIRTLQR